MDIFPGRTAPDGAIAHAGAMPSMPSPAIVTVLGMHRSGTSLCANVLQVLGVDMAEGPGASPANQRGHWERARG